MQRAPWPVGLVFGLALAVVILLAGPLLLFNPWFVSALQARHDVPAALGAPPEQVDRLTSALLGDIYALGEFDAPLGGSAPFLDARERSHMQDVSRLVRLLWGAVGVALAVVALSAFVLRAEPGRVGRLMLASAAGIGLTAVVLAIVFALAFEPAFLAFHAIFFPPGTYLFEPGSDLIVLFPEPFWFEASLAAGAAIAATALAVTLIGWRVARRGGS